MHPTHQPASTSRRGGLSFALLDSVDAVESTNANIATVILIPVNRKRFLKAETEVPKLNVDGSSPFTRFHPDDDETTALGSRPRAVPHRATRQKRSTPRLGLGRRTPEPDAAERLPAGTDSASQGFERPCTRPSSLVGTGSEVNIATDETPVFTKHPRKRC